jgi:cysteinyl-tRNA synthetase
VYQDGAKMAKSTGNLTLVADLLRQHRPATVRLLVLNRAWRAPWQFDPGELDVTATTLDRLYAAAGRPTTGGATGVTAALLTDLDVPRAVAIALDEGGAAARLLLDVLALS